MVYPEVLGPEQGGGAKVLCHLRWPSLSLGDRYPAEGHVFYDVLADFRGDVLFLEAGGYGVEVGWKLRR